MVATHLTVIILLSLTTFVDSYAHSTPAVKIRRQFCTSASTSSFFSSSSSPSSPSQPPTTQPKPKPKKLTSRQSYTLRSRYSLGNRQIKHQQYSSAIATFSSLLHDHPTDSHTYVALGALHQRLSNDSLSIETYQTGLVNCPDNVFILTGYALNAGRIGDNALSKTLFQRVLTLDPTNPYAAHGLAMLIYRGGDISEAIDILSETIKFKKGRTGAVICSLGELLTVHGKVEESRAVYERFGRNLSLAKDRTEVMLGWAQLEEKHFNSDQRATTILQDAITLNAQSSSPPPSEDEWLKLALKKLVEKGKEKGKKNSSSSSNSNSSSSSSSSSNSTSISNSNSNSLSFSQHKPFNVNLVGNAYLSSLSPPSPSPSPSPTPSSTSSFRANLHAALNNPTTLPPKLVPTDAALLILWAEEKLKQNTPSSLPKAREILLLAHSNFPKDASVLHFHGIIEEKSRNFVEARRLFERSLEIHPTVETHMCLARLLTRISSSSSSPRAIKSAERHYELAMILNNRHGALYNSFASFYEVSKGNVTKAREIYTKGVRMNCTDSTSVYHGYAKLELKGGNVELAKQILKAGLRVSKTSLSSNYAKSSRLSHTLGMVLFNENNLQTAKEVFTDGMQRSHRKSRSRLALGLALVEARLGNDDEARKMFNLAIVADEKHPHAWQAWGVMEQQRGNFIVAKKLFEKGLKTNPQHGALWQAYGNMESRRGNLERARRLLKAGFQKCSNDVHVLQAWASLELKMGNVDDSKALLSTAISLDKSVPSVWSTLLKFEEQNGNNESCETVIAQGLINVKGDARLLLNVGNYYVRRGRFGDARRCFEMALECDPTFAPVYHSFAECEARLGNIAGISRLNKLAAMHFRRDGSLKSPYKAAGRTLTEEGRG